MLNKIIVVVTEGREDDTQVELYRANNIPAAIKQLYNAEIERCKKNHITVESDSDFDDNSAIIITSGYTMTISEKEISNLSIEKETR